MLVQGCRQGGVQLPSLVSSWMILRSVCLDVSLIPMVDVGKKSECGTKEGCIKISFNNMLVFFRSYKLDINGHWIGFGFTAFSSLYHYPYHYYFFFLSFYVEGGRRRSTDPDVPVRRWIRHRLTYSSNKMRIRDLSLLFLPTVLNRRLRLQRKTINSGTEQGKEMWGA